MKKTLNVCDKCQKTEGEATCVLCGGLFCVKCGRHLMIQNINEINITPKKGLIGFLYREIEKNDIIKNTIFICENCIIEYLKIMDKFFQIPVSIKKPVTVEVLKLLKEKMEATILASSI